MHRHCYRRKSARDGVVATRADGRHIYKLFITRECMRQPGSCWNIITWTVNYKKDLKNTYASTIANKCASNLHKHTHWVDVKVYVLWKCVKKNQIRDQTGICECGFQACVFSNSAWWPLRANVEWKVDSKQNALQFVRMTICGDGGQKSPFSGVKNILESVLMLKKCVCLYRWSWLKRSLCVLIF